MITSVETETASPRTRIANSWLFPVMLFFAVAMVLAIVVQTSHTRLSPEKPQLGPDISDAAFYGGWMQYDTGWYVYIAEHGYDDPQVAAFKAGEQSAVAYFPAYPLTVRQVARFTGSDYVLAAQVTTMACGLAVLLLFWVWCGRRLSPAARRTAVLLFALYPYAWFLYGSGYGDVFFIALTVIAFLLLERDRPVLAGLVGAGASATRLVGVGTIIGLIAMVIERRHALVRTEADGPRRPWSGWRLDRSRLRLRDGGVLLSFAGVGAYCLFLWSRVGDPIAFNTVQSAPGWNQGTGPKTWIKYSFFADVIKGGHSYGTRLMVQALLCLVFLIAIPFVAKRIGAAYATYTAVVIVIPLIGTSTMQGFGRYLLSAFPVFAVAGGMLAERARPRLAVLVCSSAMLLGFASYFGRGFYLS
jgi:hypothetical protein